MSRPRRRDTAARVVGYPAEATSALYFAINRDLRRAALFLWMTPLFATRSRTLAASRVAASAATGSPAAIANSAFFTNVRADVRRGLLRSRLRSATRILFFADFELAKPRCPPFVGSIKYPPLSDGTRNSTKLAAAPQPIVTSSGR